MKDTARFPLYNTPSGETLKAKMEGPLLLPRWEAGGNSSLDWSRL